MYMSKKINSSVGGWMRENMGFKNTFSPKGQDGTRGFNESVKHKSDKKVRIADGNKEDDDI